MAQKSANTMTIKSSEIVPVTGKVAGKKPRKKGDTKPGKKAKPGDGRIGNQFWKLRSKHGRDKLFATPELLWEAACEYFQWCESHPLWEMKAFAYQGVVTTKKMPKMRAMTLSQLCFYLHCNEAYFRNFKAQLPGGEKDFNTVIADIEKVIYDQKFQGAAADLLNANIIARDLGLKEHNDITSKDERIEPGIDYSKLDDDTLRAITAARKSQSGKL